MSSAVNTRERFLQDAAASLPGSDASSADYLRRNALSIRALRDGTCQPAPSACCSACGSLEIESRHVELKNKQMNPSGANLATKIGAEAQRLYIRKCRKCSRSTKHPVTAAGTKPGKQIAEIDANGDEAKTTDTPVLAPRPPSAKSSSKKRAKERKDREGLKAVMAKPKDKSSAAGFSLMDFMSSSNH